MFNNIIGKLYMNMSSSNVFKSVVAVSTAYVAGKIVEQFSVYKQENIKLKINKKKENTKLKINNKKEDTKLKIAEMEKEIILKQMDTKISN